MARTQAWRRTIGRRDTYSSNFCKSGVKGRYARKENKWWLTSGHGRLQAEARKHVKARLQYAKYKLGESVGVREIKIIYFAYAPIF